MRKLIVCNIMSLDGYYEASLKNLMPMFDYRTDNPEDDSFDIYNAARLRAADTLLLGRSSYLALKDRWPKLMDDPMSSPVEQEIAQLYNDIDKVVVSDNLTEKDIPPWLNTWIVRRKDAYQRVAELKRENGKEILMFGSRTLWHDLLAHELVDELHLMVSPVVVGAGTPVFDGAGPATFQLVDVTRMDGSALVLTRYDVHSKNGHRLASPVVTRATL